MKLSKKKQRKIRAAIHSTIMDIRLDFQRRPNPLPAKDDATLAQVEHAIWDGVCKALGVDLSEEK